MGACLDYERQRECLVQRRDVGVPVDCPESRKQQQRGHPDPGKELNHVIWAFTDPSTQPPPSRRGMIEGKDGSELQRAAAVTEWDASWIAVDGSRSVIIARFEDLSAQIRTAQITADNTQYSVQFASISASQDRCYAAA